MNTETTYWFNNMPKHWQIKRLKDNIIFQPNVAVPADNAFVTFMPMECLRDGVIQQREEIYSEIKKNGSYNAFENGDIVIAKVTPCFEHHNMAIAVNLKNGIGYGTSEIFVLRPKNINTPFLNYYLHSDYILGVGVSSMAGVGGLKRVNADVLKHAILILPPLAEQIKIANYLDNKISNIDAYVSERKKERLLLSDLKKAKVAEIVTKGLSPNVRLKDSGIPSIGMIPAHWEVRRIKDIASEIFMGTTPVYEYEAENSNYILGQRNNQLEGITFEGVKFAKDSFFAQRQEYEFLKYGDVLLNTLGGGSVGRAGYYNLDNSKRVITDGHIMVIRSKTYNTKYLYFYLLSIKEQLENMAIGSTNQSFFNISDIRIIPIVVPPIEEQIQIVEYLDHECDQIEKKCALINEQIQQLQLLKRALINEVVTGKKAI